MSSVLFPNTTINIASNNPTISTYPHKVLFIGQKASSGTATAGELITDIQDDNSWDTLFGKRSMLSGMLRAARRINKQTRFDAICLADATGGSSAAATASIVFSGTATSAGQLIFDIGSAINHRYVVDVVVGDTAAGIATKLETLADADDKAPFTAAVSTATITFTAANVGTVGNSFPIEYTGSIAGISITLNGFASGATPPTLTNLFDVIGEERYHTIVWPSDYGLATVKTFLDARFNVNNLVQDGLAITTRVSSYADHITELNSHNSRSINAICFNLLNTSKHKGSDMVEIPYVVSAIAAAVRSLRLTEGTNITAYNINTSASFDNEGGVHQATKPYANTPIPFLPIPGIGKGFTSTQVANLRTAGGSIIGANSARNGVVMGEMVTTYKTDAAGNADTTFKYLNAVDAASVAREYIFNNIKRDCSSSRLTDGDLIPNISIQNATSIRGLLVRYFEDLGSQDRSIAQSGSQAVQFFKDNLEVTVEADTGTVRATMVMPLISQFRSFIATMRVDFTI